MFMRGKRLLALVLALVMVCGLVPAGPVQAAQSEAGRELTQADYAAADLVFDQIEAMESAPAKKNATQDEKTQAAMQIVQTSDSYVEGSLDLNGASFTWTTDSGVRCVYSPRMQKIQKNTTPENGENVIVNEPKAVKGGSPSGNQVYLVGPYYGQDPDFTDQYKTEARRVASAIGDTDGYTLYSGKAATVDKVAEAVSNGAVVFFDSHGMTDYENPYDEYDCVTGATSSYLCLTSTTGLTSADYADGALYDSTGIWINGATIANHMTKNSPSGILWMAICLGMATNTMCEPLRAKGVEVVYGYSESVTFAGDYLYEETFWGEMIKGETVASSIATMKREWGNWDWSEQMAEYYGYDDGYASISAARYDFVAFPIVVSDEDAHPGQRKGSSYGADIVQNVKSTYTLYTQYDVTAQSNNGAWGSVSISGNTITAKPAAGYFAQSATVVSGNANVSQNGNSFHVAAESDCVIQINFAPKTAVTVNFSGADVAGQTGYAGDTMTLPTAQAPDGYQFLGWMSAPLSGDTTEKPTFYTDSFVPTESTTLYALYSYVDATSGSGSGDYVKVTESREDWAGEYLIVYEADGRVFDGSLSKLESVSNYQNVTIRDNTISAEEADAYRFIIEAVTGGYSIRSASGSYISGTAASNALNEGTTPVANSISIDASGNADIVSNTSHLRYNPTSGQDRFRYYKSSTYSNQKAVALYIKDGSAGTVYYTSALCDHANTQNTAAIAPTCTQEGYTAGVQCTNCKTYVSGHEVVAALGHNYVGSGMIYTCTDCGATYMISTTTPLQYVFSDYTAGTQYAQGEEHALDDVVTLIINGAHLNSQVRLYDGSNAVLASEKDMESVVVKAGYRAATLNVYSSVDGEVFELVAQQSTSTSYINYSFDLPAGTRYVMLESDGAQIRVSEVTVVVLENSSAVEPVVGDMTGDSQVNNDDVVALLWSSLFPEDYPLSVNADLNGDGEVNNDDVAKLLWNTLFPEEYPL